MALYKYVYYYYYYIIIIIVKGCRSSRASRCGYEVPEARTSCYDCQLVCWPMWRLQPEWARGQQIRPPLRQPGRLSFVAANYTHHTNDGTSAIYHAMRGLYNVGR